MSNPQYNPYPPQQWPPAPAPRKPKRKKWPFVVGGIVLLFIIIGISNGGNSETATAPAAPLASKQSTSAAERPAVPAPAVQEEKPDQDTITYEVTGKGVSKANNITYVKDSKFSQQQANNVKLPFTKDVQLDNGLFDYQPMSLVAQSGSGGNGEITCRILKNGQELTSSTSSGPYAVVTCSG